MPFTRPSALARITEVGIVPVIRASSAKDAEQVAHALLAGGLRILEITMTVPGALDVLASLARTLDSDVLLGAGTVTSAAMVDSAVKSGAAFVVTPSVVPDVIAAARTHDVACIGGALTPTEVFATHRAGADVVKVFPAATAGGPAYIRALKGPFPAIPLMATGGIGLDEVGAYLQAGVVAVGAGSELISKSAVAAGDFAAITRATQAFLAAARAARA
jgi:2-dehydro-3-deoxyphosphogluconate aldolase/(4S)-4-hydroxy-2-oxoglutarate aldolase